MLEFLENSWRLALQERTGSKCSGVVAMHFQLQSQRFISPLLLLLWKHVVCVLDPMKRRTLD
jgi:hypothetical protein